MWIDKDIQDKEDELMNAGFLLSALAIISALTTLTVEGIKKILDEKKKEYSSNVLAVIVSFALTIIGSALYMIYNTMPITPQAIVTIICLVFLSFLAATVGYDKIKQLLEQIGK